MFDPFFTTSRPAGDQARLEPSLRLHQAVAWAHQDLPEIGAGTTAGISSPRPDRWLGAGRARAGAVDPKGDAGETILVVEDDPLMRQMSADALADPVSTVLDSDSGAAACAFSTAGRDRCCSSTW